MTLLGSVTRLIIGVLVFVFLCGEGVQATDTCKSKFQKVFTASQGLFARCHAVGGGKGFTLDQCYQAACLAKGATTFNFGKRGCSIRRCTDGVLRTSNRHGGHDIYTIEGYHGVPNNCAMPFKYNGETHTQCIKQGGEKPWCSQHGEYRGAKITCPTELPREKKEVATPTSTEKIPPSTTKLPTTPIPTPIPTPTPTTTATTDKRATATEKKIATNKIVTSPNKIADNPKMLKETATRKKVDFNKKKHGMAQKKKGVQDPQLKKNADPNHPRKAGKSRKKHLRLKTKLAQEEARKKINDAKAAMGEADWEDDAKAAKDAKPTKKPGAGGESADGDGAIVSGTMIFGLIILILGVIAVVFAVVRLFMCKDKYAAERAAAIEGQKKGLCEQEAADHGQEIVDLQFPGEKQSGFSMAGVHSGQRRSSQSIGSANGKKRASIQSIRSVAEQRRSALGIGSSTGRRSSKDMVPASVPVLISRHSKIHTSSSGNVSQVSKHASQNNSHTRRQSRIGQYGLPTRVWDESQTWELASPNQSRTYQNGTPNQSRTQQNGGTPGHGWPPAPGHGRAPRHVSIHSRTQQFGSSFRNQ